MTDVPILMHFMYCLFSGEAERCAEEASNACLPNEDGEVSAGQQQSVLGEICMICSVGLCCNCFTWRSMNCCISNPVCCVVFVVCSCMNSFLL